MECDLCLAEKKVAETSPQTITVVIRPAVFAVKEDEVLLTVCAAHMVEFYGMHETTLIPGDTYVPCDDEE